MQARAGTARAWAQAAHPWPAYAWQGTWGAMQRPLTKLYRIWSSPVASMRMTKAKRREVVPRRRSKKMPPRKGRKKRSMMASLNPSACSRRQQGPGPTPLRAWAGRGRQRAGHHAVRRGPSQAAERRCSPATHPQPLQDRRLWRRQQVVHRAQQALQAEQPHPQLVDRAADGIGQRRQPVRQVPAGSGRAARRSSAQRLPAEAPPWRLGGAVAGAPQHRMPALVRAIHATRPMHTRLQR